MMNDALPYRMVFLLTALVSTLATAAPAGAPGGKLRVVTTLSVLQDFAREIGGERMEVQALADPHEDPHFVQPRPTLMKRAREADAFIEIGLQLELWTENLLAGSGNPRIQLGQPGLIVASNNIATLELPQTLSREWGDVHPYGNPHIWLDPLNVRQMVENIAGGFKAIDPAGAAYYDERLAAYQQRLDEALFGAELLREVGAGKLTRLARQGSLHEFLAARQLSAKLGGWLAQAERLRGRKIVSYHKTWVYFARRFGLTVAIEIEEKPGIEPSARHRDRVIAVMKAEGIDTILIENFYPRAAADYIAAQTGARVVVVPIDVGPGTVAPNYFRLIDHLLASLQP
ncbi:MAG: metal ABC transporter substrate-binding protein [candidate division KSB1 bacterium]|nr:metal ABC transporter substrate-binding protein [candidate division KSB1 bacterium]MDZ7273477.1 metal ABC transporter substrate-binding protein [candidate division KSB1 bacterium]MDZ7286931.1 metal ABC transporter substrate-binding protein [candidate division KSB1 bacterium]MDZ7299716.1 metal ABC transporter substrate-binding protein [candidate division KSB1 bacterium]MDZ7305655.1 metal ABC transporter substrate-binding protein [candidate division KSB1 bacterium]